MQPNSVKDSSLTTRRNLLNFTNKDPSKLKEDLEKFFNEFEEIEREMTQRTKMVELAKMEHFTGMISCNCKILTKALEDIDIMEDTMTFEDFKRHLLKSAERIGTRIRNEQMTQSRKVSSTDTIMSSNSTIENVNSTTVTVDKAQYDRMEEALRRSKRDRSSSAQRDRNTESRQENDKNRSRSRSEDSRSYQGSRQRRQNSESRERSPKRGRQVTFTREERPTSSYARSTSPHANFSRK